VQRSQRREQQGGEECEGVFHGLGDVNTFQYTANRW
jgi:hypothetical protein